MENIAIKELNQEKIILKRKRTLAEKKAKKEIESLINKEKEIIEKSNIILNDETILESYREYIKRNLNSFFEDKETYLKIGYLNKKNYKSSYFNNILEDLVFFENEISVLEKQINNIKNNSKNLLELKKNLRKNKYIQNLLNNKKDLKDINKKLVEVLSNAWESSKNAKQIGNIGHFDNYYCNNTMNYEKAKNEYRNLHLKRFEAYEEKVEYVNEAIKIAKKENINYGKKDGIIYFDLPDSRQISFHDFKNQYKTNRVYSGEWSGFVTSKNPLKKNKKEYIEDIINIKMQEEIEKIKFSLKK